MILNDKSIRKYAVQGMITPFVDGQVRQVTDQAMRKVLSFGLSSYGYDVRLDKEVKIFSNINGSIIDPKRFNDDTLVDARIYTDTDGALYVILPPSSYLLGVTMEYFKIPRNVTVMAVGKSTMARCACIVNVTPIEAGFEGNVVIEISNASTLPVKVYLEEGISQFIFWEGEPCEVSYGDRDGKYQRQTGIQTAKV